MAGAPPGAIIGHLCASHTLHGRPTGFQSGPKPATTNLW